MTPILSRRRTVLRRTTYAFTRAQQSFVDMELATNPIAKEAPELAAAVAAAHGWPVKPRQLSAGEHLLALVAKG